MGRSRYAGNKVFGDHYGTWDNPVTDNILGPDILDGVDTVDYIYGIADRLDLLAYKYYGDSDYWWIIALANNVQDPFSVAVGQRLKIPQDIRAILGKIQR